MAYPICEQCRAPHRVLMAMLPGKDGQEWYLCARCWIAGSRRPDAKKE